MCRDNPWKTVIPTATAASFVVAIALVIKRLMISLPFITIPPLAPLQEWLVQPPDGFALLPFPWERAAMRAAFGVATTGSSTMDSLKLNPVRCLHRLTVRDAGSEPAGNPCCDKGSNGERARRGRTHFTSAGWRRRAIQTNGSRSSFGSLKPVSSNPSNWPACAPGRRNTSKPRSTSAISRRRFQARSKPRKSSARVPKAASASGCRSTNRA